MTEPPKRADFGCRRIKRAQRDALAGAGFAEQRERLAPPQGKIDAGHSTHGGAATDAEVDCELLHVDDGNVVHHAATMAGTDTRACPESGFAMWQAARWSAAPVMQNGFIAAADRLGVFAARVEATAGRRIDRVGRIARDRRLLRTVVRIHRRHRGEQRSGVWMVRLAEHGIGWADLGDLAEIHHHHAVRHEADHVEVVRDEDVGQPELVLEVEQQVEHLRLDRLVERRHRFVEDQKPRVEREPARDVDALALTAGDFVRIAPGEARQARDPTRRSRSCARSTACLWRHAVHARTERDGVLHGQARIERGVAVLEDHLDLPAERREVQRGRADRLAVEQQRRLRPA